MHLYSIMPLNLAHVDEICNDIERQYKDGIATEALFFVPLTPEGDPVIDKAKIAGEKFKVFSDKLAERGLKCGILVQATIGHGGRLRQRAPYQSLVGLTDGRETFTTCPYDEDFRHYIKESMKTLASYAPSSIMVDDDFRLIAHRATRGCACPLHLRAIGQRLGREIDRETLAALLEEKSAEGERTMKAYYESVVDSLVGAAKAMREGIDEVDPHLQGSFCACGDLCEGAEEIAKVLAGEGNPVIVRINNGNYTPAGARGVSSFVSRAATQMAVMKNGVDSFLAETDTCPHNRYSTSASSMHTHFTLTILEGASGCKHWITRLPAFEPRSGEAYRRKLARYAGFYRELSRLYPTLDFKGCRIPLPDRAVIPTVPFSQYKMVSENNAWASCVLERLGLPHYYSSKKGGAVCLDSARDSYFTDEEIREMLSGTVLLAAESAENLIARGFGDQLGVDVLPIPTENRRAATERIFANGEKCSCMMNLHELRPKSEKLKVKSTVMEFPDGKTELPLFPGVTVYENPLGGQSVVFSGTPRAFFNHVEAFSFLNESRKLQLIEILCECGHLPVYYPDDAEVYLKAALTEDGNLFCAFVNIGLDPIEEITLVPDRKIARIKKLQEDGTYEDCSFEDKNGTLTLDSAAGTLDPVILILEYS